MRLHYATDDGLGMRARFGLIVLQVDETIEHEFPRLVGTEGVALHFTRVPSGREVTQATLAAMEADIPNAATLLPPGTRYDAIGYACTSGATVIGPENVVRAVRGARPGDGPEAFTTTPVTDPLTAVKAACRALEVTQLGFVTPYVPVVSSALRASLEEDGLEIVASGSFEQAEEHVVARITRVGLVRAGRGARRRAHHPRVDPRGNHWGRGDGPLPGGLCFMHQRAHPRHHRARRTAPRHPGAVEHPGACLAHAASRRDQ
jgi:maleate isomerase